MGQIDSTPLTHCGQIRYSFLLESECQLHEEERRKMLKKSLKLSRNKKNNMTSLHVLTPQNNRIDKNKLKQKTLADPQFFIHSEHVQALRTCGPVEKNTRRKTITNRTISALRP